MYREILVFGFHPGDIGKNMKEKNAESNKILIIHFSIFFS